MSPLSKGSSQSLFCSSVPNRCRTSILPVSVRELYSRIKMEISYTFLKCCSVCYKWFICSHHFKSCTLIIINILYAIGRVSNPFPPTTCHQHEIAATGKSKRFNNRIPKNKFKSCATIFFLFFFFSRSHFTLPYVT